MSRSEFVENLYSLPRVYSSEIYTSADIATKIAILQSGKPNFPQKEVTKWKRVHERFKLLSYQGTNILYLRERKNQPAKRVLSTEELFDTLERLHKVEGDHPGRTRLYKRASQEFYGVTERVCGIFVKICVVCHLKKSKKSLKTIVIKPIESTDYLCRAQVDLINDDFNTSL